MNLLNSLRILFVPLAIVASLGAYAYPGESIVLDPATGDYTITYWDEEEPASLEKGTFIPSTKIDPSVQSKFHMGEKGTVSYRYKVHSGSSSRQIIGTVRLEFAQNIIGSQDWPKTNRETITESQLAAVYDANNTALAKPEGWSGGIYSRNGYRISWNSSPNPDTGIRPGSSQDGFGFSSQALPGVGFAQLEGDHPPRGWSGHGPTEKSAIKAELERLEDNDFVPCNAAVPTIAVPDPFDAATLLERIQTQMHTWIGKQLLDATFSSQLDRYFQSAISAYRLNQPKVGKKEIQTMRELLKKEHADADRDEGGDDRGEKGDHDDKNKQVLIDKLAARILDFDLKYVTKRMGGDRDD
jgi:hypothetical protein